jgi:serine/threonine-protein kinase RsbW
MSSCGLPMGTTCNTIQVDIVVPNQTRYLRLIGEKIAKELDQYPGDHQALAYHLNLVLTEAMVNAIEHGNTGDPCQTVHVSIRILEDKLCIEVCDQG